MLDYLIKNARIVDGSGSPAFTGCIGIKDGKFVSVRGDEPAIRVIDAAGRIAAPGFIDAHSHGDLILGSRDARLFKTQQGVTTELTGQCGLSMAPAAAENLASVQTLLTMGTAHFPREMADWNTFSQWMDYAERCPKTADLAAYVGHSTLRIAVMGMADRPATAHELDIMKGLLREAMEAGACGFSSGLIYTPSCYAEEEELVELAKVLAPFGGVYASHMRNEANDVVHATEETIRIGKKAGVMVDISHHKVMGRANWGKHRETLRMIHEANEQGFPVICDQYPYPRSMTTLNACMPPWYFSDGFAVMTERLKDPTFRAKVRAEMEDPNGGFDNSYLNSGGWDGVTVYLAAETPEAEGRTVAEYADLIGKDPWTAFFDLCVANQCATGGVYASMSEDDVCDIIRDPYCIIGSDGLTRSWTEKGHPRASATFPHAINWFVKEKKILTLEECIRKMTGQTADFFSIEGKGYIREGCDADLVLFDLDRLHNPATFTDPNRVTEGIELVFSHGQPVWEQGDFTGALPGRVLRFSR